MAELTVVRNYTYQDLVTAGANSNLTDVKYKPNRTPAERLIAHGYLDPVWKSPQFTGQFSGDSSDIAMITPAIPSDQFSGFCGLIRESSVVAQSSPVLCIRLGDTLSGDDIDLTTGFYKDIEPAYAQAVAAWDTLRPAKSYDNKTIPVGAAVGATYFWGLEGNSRAPLPPYIQIGVVLAATEADVIVKCKLYANYL